MIVIDIQFISLRLLLVNVVYIYISWVLVSLAGLPRTVYCSHNPAPPRALSLSQLLFLSDSGKFPPPKLSPSLWQCLMLFYLRMGVMVSALRPIYAGLPRPSHLALHTVQRWNSASLKFVAILPGVLAWACRVFIVLMHCSLVDCIVNLPRA